MAVNVGTLLVDVRFNTGDLSRRLEGELGRAGARAGDAASSSISGRLKSLGTSVGNFGRQLTVGLTLPLVAFGHQAVQAFVGFDKAMTQIVALAGVNREVVQGWRGDVMALGAQWGVSAAEAAKALYFITSSGVEAANALGVLDIAVKGQAVGLGTATQVADAVTSAMNAYGKENVSAAKAADILTVAVREGKGEASQMAGALSSVIPLAAGLGVSYGQVAGSMSAMTLSGTTADEAATQLRGILNTFTDMTPQAQRALKAYTGLDYATLRLRLRSEGLIPVLKDVVAGFEGNTAAISEVFPNIRANVGVMNLFGAKTQQTTDIVKQAEAAQGDFNKAVEETERSPAFRLAKAQANLDAAMTNIGASVVPVVSGLTEVFAEFLHGLAQLPGPIQTTAIGLGTLAAAAGPMLYVGSSVMRLAGNIGQFLPSLGALQGSLTRLIMSGNPIANMFGRIGAAGMAVLGPLAAAAATAVVAFTLLNAKLGENEAKFKAIADQGVANNIKPETWEELEDRVNSAGQAVNSAVSEIDAIDRKPKENMFGWLYGDIASQFDIAAAYDRRNAQEGGEAARKVYEHGQRLLGQAAVLTKTYLLSRTGALEWIKAQERLGIVFKDDAAAVAAFKAALDAGDPSAKKAQNTVEKAIPAWDALAAKVKETSDSFFGVLKAQDAYEDSLIAIEDAKTGVIDAEKAYAKAIQASENAARQIVAADRNVIRSGEKLAESRRAVTVAQLELDRVLLGKEDALDLRSSQLGVREARKALTESDATDPLARQRARIAFQRAQLDLEKARGQHDRNVDEARKNVQSAEEAVLDAEAAQADAIKGAQDARIAYNDSLEAQAKAHRDIGKAQEAVRDAELSSLGAAEAYAGAQSTLNNLFQSGTAKSQEFHKYLTDLKNLYPELTGVVDEYIQKYKLLDTSIGEVGNMKAGFQSERAIEGRAGGGPVGANRTYEVNERNVPELYSGGGRQYLIPVGSGSVIPLAAEHLPVAGGDGATYSDTINIYETGNARQTAYEVRREKRKASYLSGRQP